MKKPVKKESSTPLYLRIVMGVVLVVVALSMSGVFALMATNDSTTNGTVPGLPIAP
jgi:hypothetical protein